MKLWFFFLDICYGLRYIFAEAPRGLDFFRMYDPYGGSDGNMRYQTKSYGKISKILQGYVDEKTCLLDAGCGKGHFIYCARRLGCARADGLELDSGLSAIALGNMEKLGLEDTDIICMDARDFTAFDKYDTIYLFNPFGKDVMQNFLRNIEASLDRTPRDMTVIYANPDQRALWDSSPYFELSESRIVPQVMYDIHVFYYTHRLSFRDRLGGMI